MENRDSSTMLKRCRIHVFYIRTNIPEHKAPVPKTLGTCLDIKRLGEGLKKKKVVFLSFGEEFP